MFTLQMLQGTEALKDPSSVLLSASAAKAFFGDAMNDNPINKLMKIDDMPPVKVTGVYKDFPRNSTFADLNFIATWDFLYNSNND